MHLKLEKLAPNVRHFWYKIFSLPIISLVTFAACYAFFTSVGTEWTENLPASVLFTALITTFVGLLLVVKKVRWIFPALVGFLFLVFKLSGQNTSMFLFFQDLLPFCPVSHYCVDSHFGKDVALLMALITDVMLMLDCIVFAIGIFVAMVTLKAYWRKWRV